MSRHTPLFLLLTACGAAHDLPELAAAADSGVTPPVEVPAVHIAAFEASPDPSPRLDHNTDWKDIPTKVSGYFATQGSRRVHVQLDRPMYKPGETVWLAAWHLDARSLTQSGMPQLQAEVVDPRGQVVKTLQVPTQGRAVGRADVQIPADAAGGRWLIRATLPTGEVDERPFVVSSYVAPRVKKTLDFVREAYGAGERVEALVEMTGANGQPLADHPVRALLQVGGAAVEEVELTTDETGAVFVATGLPAELSSSDGLLTVFVEDGGVTESISRSVPIVLSEVNLAFFPEGGDLVEGLPGRVYFEATNAHGEPADVAGYVLDDQGQRVAELSSVHDGMGRFLLTPEAGRTYKAVLTAPAGIRGHHALPEAHASGCVLRSFDDVASTQESVRVDVRCSKPQNVLVAGVLRNNPLDFAAVEAGPEGATVHLSSDAIALKDAQGAVRVTVFDPKLNPLAERLVYRGHGRNLNIEVTSDRDTYGPRDEVVLQVKTTQPSGEPVSAEVALSVADDAVLGLADDENGHMLSRIYLEPELLESPDDPAFYFDPDEALAARGVDLVLGTKGHRRFEWTQVWNPPPLPPTVTALQGLGYLGYVDTMDEGAAGGGVEIALAEAVPRPRLALRGEVRERARVPRQPAAMPVEEAEAPPMGAAAVAPVLHDAKERQQARIEGRKDARMGMAKAMPMREPRADFDDIHRMGGEVEWATVRVFPVPDYRDGFHGIRSDFRDTVMWVPDVKTDANGHAEVRFYLSDALTSFRVTAEGIGGGAAGHAETTLTSALPVSVATRLPTHVSAGDVLSLPLTVTNSRPEALSADVSAQVTSKLIRLGDHTGTLSLGAGASGTHWVDAQVQEGAGKVAIRMSAEGGGLTDTLEKSLVVVPPGFPRTWARSSDGAQEQSYTFTLDEVVPGSLMVSATWQPSTVSTLVQGMEGLIQTPGGCFEQTSSTNWPNVAILRYLEAFDGDPRLRVASAQALEVGYNKLSGYQVGAGGFETWGTGPGKEVLSAFGLLQFDDMADVFPVDKGILTRDIQYLLDQRDGHGGFKNTGESAHGYGSAPKPVLDGFITYALVETGNVDKLQREVKHQAKVAETTDDPYVLALAARVLGAAEHPGADKARDRLVKLQAEDGSFPGAKSSITRSYEANLLVESTALAALALMEDPSRRRAVDSAVTWIMQNRRAHGTWGATQATALALDALTTHAELNKRPRTGGKVQVEVNGTVVDTLRYRADRQEPLVIDGWEGLLKKGENTVVVRQLEGENLPLTVAAEWTSITPTSAPGAELGLTTELSTDRVSMGETVRLTARLDNRTEAVVPSPIARIGLPAGLSAQSWQLEQLRERGIVAFYETRAREVTLYWDGIHTDEVHEVKLDLVAELPGRFTGPASQAHPYYDDDEVAWQRGLTIEVTP